MLEGWQPRSLRACSRDDPECGARRGVPRWRLRNRSPREAREVARQALRPGCEELAVTDPAQMPAVAKLWRACSKSAEASAEADAGERSAAPGAQNRHGGAPRGERPASWDARRLASAWPAASCAGPTGASHAPERLSALRPPSIRVGEAKLQTLGADMRRGNEMGCLKVNNATNASDAIACPGRGAARNEVEPQARSRASIAR